MKQIKVLPPHNIWYEMENGVYEEVVGAIIHGAWRPQSINFLVFFPIGVNKREWQEIDEQLALNLDWNKIIPLLEERYAAGKLSVGKRIRVNKILHEAGVLTVEQVPRAVINGQVTDAVNQLKMNPEFAFSFQNEANKKSPVIEIEYKENSNPC